MRRDDGVLERGGISWTRCKQSAPCFSQITTPTPHHSIFTDRMLFLTPNQLCQSTEGIDNNCNTHTQPFNGLLSGTTRVGRYQKKHSPTHTHPDDRTSFIIFLHLQRAMATSLFSLRAWQSSRTTSLQVLFGLLW